MEIKNHFKKGIESNNIIRKCYIKLMRYSQPLNSQQIVLSQYLKKINNPILLCGFRKSGNTWVRFVIYNYFNIIINNSEKTITFDDLNKIQYHTLEDCSVGAFYPGFPHFYRTHDFYKRIFKSFKLIYLYRNPLDTLISFYYVLIKNKKGLNGRPYKHIKNTLKNVNLFVLTKLDLWIHHYKNTINKCDLVLNYEQLKEKPLYHFSKIFKLLDVELNENVLRKSIEMSSFNNIKKMAIEANQLYGNHDPKTFSGEFMRSGKNRQYLNELKPITINIAKLRLEKNNIEFNF